MGYFIILRRRSLVVRIRKIKLVIKEFIPIKLVQEEDNDETKQKQDKTKQNGLPKDKSTDGNRNNNEMTMEIVK